MLIIIEDLPPTMNDMIADARSSRYKSSSVKKHWTDRIAEVVRGNTPYTGKVWIEWCWYVKNFSRDADNIAASSKYIMDGIVEAGVIVDDNLRIIQSPVIHYYYPSDTDYFMLTIDDKPDFLLERIAETISV
jgi:Holliday junction resolvase RusA-like endonuclease